MNTDLSITIQGQRYLWYGGFGAVLISRERGKHVGDVRKINTTLLCIANIWHKPWGRKPEVCWIPVGDFDAQWIHTFKQQLFA